MPVALGKDKKGSFARWGASGKKYYYTTGDKDSREEAIAKANRQGQAAHAAGYKA